MPRFTLYRIRRSALISILKFHVTLELITAAQPDRGVMTEQRD